MVFSHNLMVTLVKKFDALLLQFMRLLLNKRKGNLENSLTMRVVACVPISNVAIVIGDSRRIMCCCLHRIPIIKQMIMKEHAFITLESCH